MRAKKTKRNRHAMDVDDGSNDLQSQSTHVLLAIQSRTTPPPPPAAAGLQRAATTENMLTSVMPHSYKCIIKIYRDINPSMVDLVCCSCSKFTARYRSGF
jgi:hypothetical protein